MTAITSNTPDEDFITIIAPSMAEVMASFAAQGLAERQYAIVHRGGRHSFRLADGEALFGGTGMVAATFARAAAR